MPPPPNLTPENLNIRDNIHRQLSKYKSVSNKTFYRAEDICSGNNVASFKMTDSIWMFDENSQDFLKGNITGSVNGLFSVRSSNKKYTFSGLIPSILFKRDKGAQDKPYISDFAISSSYPTSLNQLRKNPIGPTPSFNLSAADDADASNVVADADTDCKEAIPIPHEDEGDQEQDQHYLDEDFLAELGIDIVSSGSYDDDVVLDYSMDEEEKERLLNLAHPWEVIASVAENLTICTSPSGKIEIWQRDAYTLLHNHWLNDQIINFFSECANYSLDESDNCPSAYICSTFFFLKLGTVDLHGAIGPYRYSPVRRFFRQDGVRPWKLETICIPVHVHNNHWISAIIDVKNSRVIVIDSLTGSLDDQTISKIGEYLIHWMKDELTENKKGIIDTGTVFYIEDPFAREETIAYINSRLEYLSEGKWRVDYANYWCQVNTSDCGLHTIVAMFIHFTGATRSKFHTDDAKCIHSCTRASL